MALQMVSSLRMQAVGATLAGLPYLGSPTLDHPFALVLSAIPIERRHPGQGGDFPAVKLTMLRQQSHQRLPRYRADARNNSLQKIILLSPSRRGSQAGVIASILINL